MVIPNRFGNVWLLLTHQRLLLKPSHWVRAVHEGEGEREKERERERERENH